MARKRAISSLDSESIGVNPFLEYMRIYALNVKEKVEMFEKSDGVVVSVDNTASFKSSRKYDIEHYFKCFNRSYNRKLIGGMSLRAKELLWFIAFEMKPGFDYVIISRERFFSENLGSKRGYNKCVSELIEKQVIAKTRFLDVFFINPQFFFNGNRIKKFSDKIIEIGK